MWSKTCWPGGCSPMPTRWSPPTTRAGSGAARRRRPARGAGDGGGGWGGGGGRQAGKVGVVTGGGSGHEPAFLGYLGDGLLDAVAIGEIFSSPTARSFMD